MRDARAKLLLFVLIPLVVAAVFVACLPIAPSTAYAVDNPQFVITGTYDRTSGFEWTLSCANYDMESVVVQGEFLNREDPSDEEQPKLVFEGRIEKKLQSLGLGADDYDLQFVLPKPLIYFGENDEGDVFDSNPFTSEEDSNIFVCVDYVPSFSAVYTALEYKRKDQSDDEYVEFSVLNSGKMRFGRDIPEGEYDVRARAGESFRVYGRDFTAEETCSTSDPLRCYITAGELPDRLFSIPVLNSVYYGATIGDIADIATVFDNNGTWTLASERAQDATKRLDAREADYEIWMDFQHKNTNYTLKKNIKVPVHVSKRPIEVIVNSLDVLVGVPLVTEFEYTVVGELAPGDTLESLGFEVVAEDVDPDVEGTYEIRARISDASLKNYTVHTRTRRNDFIDYAEYCVHSNKTDVVTADQRDIVIGRAEGFIGVNVQLDVADYSLMDFSVEPLSKLAEKMKDMSVIIAYEVTLEDEQGTPVSDAGALTIIMPKRTDDYAVAFIENGEARIIVLEGTAVYTKDGVEYATFTLPDGVSGFMLLKKDASGEFDSVEWNDTLTALACLIIVFVVAGWVVIVIYFTKRRMLND